MFVPSRRVVTRLSLRSFMSCCDSAVAVTPSVSAKLLNFTSPSRSSSNTRSRFRFCIWSSRAARSRNPELSREICTAGISGISA